MHLISDDDVCQFCQSNPTVNDINSLSVHELRLVARHLEYDAGELPKSELVSIIVSCLCGDSSYTVQTEQVEQAEGDTDKLLDFGGEDMTRPGDVGAVGVTPLQNPPLTELQLQLELARLQVEQARIEAEARREEASIMANVRIEEARINAQIQSKQLESKQVVVPEFDVGRMIRLVPPFCEQDVDKYFRSFERVAQSMSWPKQQWPILLQSVLKGKAQSVYVALSDAQCTNYDVVKREILKCYELVPEAYRLQFRNSRKKPDETYVEFSRVKRDLFEQWLRSKEVNDFAQVIELILIEEFGRSISKEISAYLLEKNVTKLEDAAVLADNYALTHKFSLEKPSKFQSNNGKGDYHNNVAKKPVSVSNQKFYSTKPESTGKQRADVTKLPFKPVKTCYYCKKEGHHVKDCWKKSRDLAQSRPVCLATTDKQVPAVTLQSQGSVGTSGGSNDVTGAKSVALVSTLGDSCVLNNFVDNNVFVNNDVTPVANLHGCVDKVRGSCRGDTCVDPNLGTYNAFLSKGCVSSCEDVKQVNILRDSGALQSLMLKGLVAVEETGKKVLVKTLEGLRCVPLVSVHLQSDLFVGQALVGIVDELPVSGVDFLLGNDIAGGKMSAAPVLCDQPVDSIETRQLEKQAPDLFPVCAVTRAMTARGIEPVETVAVAEESQSATPDDELDLGTLFASVDSMEVARGDKRVDQTGLVALQRGDPELQGLFEAAEGEKDPSDVYYLRNGVLMRRWRPPPCSASDAEWGTVHQVVVPRDYRQDILKLAHDSSFAGHLGVRKTLDRIWRNFYWPGIRRDVAKFCKTCHTCQLVGKPNQPIDVAPLIPIPAFDEPFSRVLIDIVGPLPKTSTGNCYILTIMDMATRYPEAVPLRNIRAKTVIKELIAFFTKFGLPKELQSDQGSNFMSKTFKQSLQELGINQVTSSAYHPQSQGALERYHQTLKSMLRKYCYENDQDWDKGLPYLLFATRETPNESLGFSPFELLFTHEVRGPLKVLKEKWLGGDESYGLLATVTDLKEWLKDCWKVARENLTASQGKMKVWYDRKARQREFKEGDSVLVLLPVLGQPLQARYSGPYQVVKRLSPVNYVIATPDRRKSQRLCHINMIKPYFQRDTQTDDLDVPVCAVSLGPVEDEDVCSPSLEVAGTWESNSEAWAEVSNKLSHLADGQQEEFSALLMQYQDVFRDTPGRTTVACHDVDVGEANPVKQAPYRVNPQRSAILREELDYMLEHGLIQPAQSEWCSPVTLVPKPGGSYRFCIDYRKVNSITKTDSYPLPRIEECIDQVGNSKFISKFDLLKGYWQVPLSKRAQEISCFGTLGQTFKCTVMPYGMKNAPATFQRMMNSLTKDIPGCVIYIDDVVIFSDSWQEHLERVEALLRKLSNANLVVNLSKCEFVKARVQYLGYVIGQGVVAPPQAKVESICNIPVPQSRKELRRFIGMIGYYRKFIMNFATVLSPLTDLLKKDVKFVWDDKCDQAFNQLKAILCNAPVLQAPDFDKRFKLVCDASNVGAGAVLMQEDEEAVDHPVCYFSRKFNSAQRNYSTIEKELLSLIIALQHFAVYVGPSGNTVVVYTDHHPLKYLSKFRDKNQRLTRWSLYLQEFNLEIHHIKGKDNVIADCLSRS